MPKVKLDAAFCLIAACEQGKRKTDYYSDGLPGFVLECRAAGGKTFYQRYHDQNGRLRQMKIAAYGDVTFEQAKKMAQKLRSEAVLGHDPAGRKDDQKAIPTYADLATQHLAHAKTYQRSYDSTERIITNHVLPRWGKKRLDEIKQQEVGKWLADKRAGGLAPATVEKIRTMFSRSFELARQWELFDRNPVKDVPRVRFNNARERYLTSQEAEGLRLACECSSNTQLKHIVGLLLLTGARKSELLNAEWRHIDLEKRSWKLTMTKNGRGRHVPLSQPAVDIIKQLPKFDACPYLLPNPQTRKPYTDIKRAWQEARKLAGLDDLHLHDLRHSAASFMINAGIDLYTVGKMIGHVSVASTTRYSHLANDTLMAAAEAGAAKLDVNWSKGV
jgi:integrase